MGSIKIDLFKEQFVKGNMRNMLQSYHIFYYPPEQNFPTDKIWIYLHGTEKGQPRTIRSLCFENTENHRKFISNNIFANLYILEKRLMTYSDIQMTSEYRKMSLWIDGKMKWRKNVKVQKRF